MTTTKLRVEGVHKRFGDRVVLDGIDLTVDEHEVVCLIGSSGCGKSTLLRCIDLLDPIDGGRILLDDDDVTAPGSNPNAVRRRVGIVFQSFNLFPHLRVLDNVTLGPRKALGMARDQAEARGVELLDRLGLAEQARKYPDQLSGGQQQRVAIARALVGEPELLLLDEITSALDPELVGEVLKVMRDLAAKGMTMIVVTHEMGFAREVSNHVVFLHQGRLEEEGPPAQVLTQPRSDRLRAFLSNSLK